MDKEVKKARNPFSDIETTESLISYLENSGRRTNINYLHHYTTLEVAVKIIHNEQWHICSAEQMNDMLEYESGDKKKWERKLFSSLMGEDKESIAMWGMYGQPWEKGVKISIPTKEVYKWLSNATTLNEISLEDYQPTGHSIEIEKGSLKAIAVAYSNFHDTMDDGEQVLRWSNQFNKKYNISASSLGELTGYIKNKAWAYEKEHRIMLDQESTFKRGSINVPEDVINSIILTPSPLFEGDFQNELTKTIKREIKIEQSIFFEKLHIRTICGQCDYKKASANVS